MPESGHSLQRLKSRILIIDDDPNVGSMLTAVFEATGRYAIEVERDPQIAIATARVFHPDLLILDVVMPGLDGVELAARLQKEVRLRDCPIIFFTGVAEDEIPPGTAPGGHPIGYVRKGAADADIVAAVDRLLARGGPGGAAGGE